MPALLRRNGWRRLVPSPIFLIHAAAATYWADVEISTEPSRYALYPPDWRRTNAVATSGASSGASLAL